MSIIDVEYNTDLNVWDEDYIREVIAFPLNQQGMDLMMKAPTEVTEQQLREVHIKIR